MGKEVFDPEKVTVTIDPKDNSLHIGYVGLGSERVPQSLIRKMAMGGAARPMTYLKSWEFMKLCIEHHEMEKGTI